MSDHQLVEALCLAASNDLGLHCPRKTQEIKSLQVEVQRLRAAEAATASTVAAEIQDLKAKLKESMATLAKQLESNLR